MGNGLRRYRVLGMGRRGLQWGRWIVFGNGRFVRSGVVTRYRAKSGKPRGGRAFKFCLNREAGAGGREEGELSGMRFWVERWRWMLDGSIDWQ